MTERPKPGEALAQTLNDRADKRRNLSNARKNQAVARAFVKGTEMTGAEHEALQRRLKAEHLARRAERAA